MEKTLPPIWKHMPLLSLEERDRRWESLREKMAAHSLGCLLVWGSGGNHAASANMRYLTHTDATGVAVFPLKGEPVVFSSGLHTYGYLQARQQWVKDIRPNPSPENIIKALQERQLARGSIGVVGFGNNEYRWYPDLIPYRAYTNLLKGLAEARLSEANWLLDEMRMIKSSAEIEFMEKSAELAWLMFQAMVGAARPGKTEGEMFAAMVEACLAHGGEMPMIMLDSGNPPLLHGKPAPPTHRPLEKGDMVIVEYHAPYAGYTVAVEHSLSLGPPRPEFTEIHRVCQESFDRGVSRMQIGAPLGEVVEGFREPVRKAGMAYIECGVCGHGLSSPEFPSCVFGGEGGMWPEHGLARIAPVRLKENMIFGINIDVHDPKWNTDSGLMYGDTILVTRSGPRKMTRIPTELTVV